MRVFLSCPWPLKLNSTFLSARLWVWTPPLLVSFCWRLFFLNTRRSLWEAKRLQLFQFSFFHQLNFHFIDENRCVVCKRILSEAVDRNKRREHPAAGGMNCVNSWLTWIYPLQTITEGIMHVGRKKILLFRDTWIQLNKRCTFQRWTPLWVRIRMLLKLRGFG